MASADDRQQPSAQRGAAIPISIGVRRYSRTYGRIVGLLKLMLPVMAVLLVALVVLWPFLADDAKRFSEALTNARALVTEHLEVNTASYSGIGEDGQRYTVTAKTVQQESVEANQVDLTEPKADISLTDGSWVLISSNKGSLDRANQVLELIENVNVFHDLGYEFRSESATIDLVGGNAIGFEPVTGQGPFGTAEGEGFEIIDRGAQIKLTGKSKVIFANVE